MTNKRKFVATGMISPRERDREVTELTPEQQEFLDHVLERAEKNRKAGRTVPRRRR